MLPTPDLASNDRTSKMARRVASFQCRSPAAACIIRGVPVPRPGWAEIYDHQTPPAISTLKLPAITKQRAPDAATHIHSDSELLRCVVGHHSRTSAIPLNHMRKLKPIAPS